MARKETQKRNHLFYSFAINFKHFSCCLLCKFLKRNFSFIIGKSFSSSYKTLEQIQKLQLYIEDIFVQLNFLKSFKKTEPVCVEKQKFVLVHFSSNDINRLLTFRIHLQCTLLKLKLVEPENHELKTKFRLFQRKFHLNSSQIRLNYSSASTEFTVNQN